MGRSRSGAPAQVLFAYPHWTSESPQHGAGLGCIFPQHFWPTGGHKQWGEGAMKMTVNAGDRVAIQDYVNRISASLKGIDESQKQEIRAEINSHLIDRCVELAAHGAGYPVADAIADLGDPVVLGSQFMAQAHATHGI